MRVIMTGGGTGGHIYPAIAIADEIKRRYEDAEILFVGAERGLEKTLVPANGYDIKLIKVQGFNRKNMAKNVKTVKDYIGAQRNAKKIMKEFKPDFVVGTGGYASAPVIKMAHKLGIPSYIHEQNAFPGVTNKMNEKHVTKVFLGFEDAKDYFKHPEKHVVCGNPVRADFMNADREAARKKLGFGKKDFVVLAFGGSQGAGRINKAMMTAITRFNGAADVHICLGTGKNYYKPILDELKESGLELKSNIRVMEYISNMDEFLSAADLIVSRSGALTVAEVTVCGKPAVFIPFPNATGNHQFFNAKAVADKGGAVVIEEKDLDNEKLMAIIGDLMIDPERLADMSVKSHSCAPMEAVKIICDNIEELK
ncbi:MAG: undecaprenyldiphospho-muramoylpentapeptide beta-N-acetylglucosaminyltransferase [Eubacterium sp.]|nr:undecaprenyldiphospho-muramoylpentapeptide beta-N-acetylglucosaminyltransferase [Candidatus Colimonas fimequi]